MRKYYNVCLSITNNIKAIVIILLYTLIPLFNRSIGLLDRLLSVLDRTVNNDSKQEGECEHCVLRRCRSQHHQNKCPVHRQNKSCASNTSAKQENLSADAII